MMDCHWKMYIIGINNVSVTSGRHWKKLIFFMSFRKNSYYNFSVIIQDMNLRSFQFNYILNVYYFYLKKRKLQELAWARNIMTEIYYTSKQDATEYLSVYACLCVNQKT